MKKTSFLVPVAAAAAALSGAAGHASVVQGQAQTAPATPLQSAGADAVGTLLTYVRGDQQHQMLMKRDESGTVLAYHQSHSSHSSHSSHASHRSSAY